MTRYIKITLPINSPEGTLKLAKKISEKHTELGVDSPLIGFLDMADFELRRADAALKQKNGDDKMRDSQAFHGQAKKMCGISEGQNKQSEGTLYWWVLQLRDILKTKNRGQEENLSPYGFNVVISQTGARRNVRIDIPDGTPEALSTLAKAIKDKHVALGVNSQLNNTGLDMAEYIAKTDAAVAKVTEAKDAAVDAQVFHGQALSILGYSEGQTSETEGTIYYDIITIRDRLMQVNTGDEENLSQWGYDVVVSEHSAGGKNAIAITVQTTLPIGQNGNLDISQIIGSELGEPKSVDFQSIDSNGKFFASETEAGLPGAGPVYDVAAGDKLTKSPVQVSAELGLSETKPFLNVQNSGLVTGTYKVTFRF